jgi:hypothetical protein
VGSKGENGADEVLLLILAVKKNCVFCRKVNFCVEMFSYDVPHLVLMLIVSVLGA